MFFNLLYPLSDSIGIFNVFQYLTFRTGAAVLTAIALVPQGAVSQEAAVTGAPGLSHAFVDVSVLPMDSERVLPGQTVIVSDGRIVRVGAAADVDVPATANVIDGRGRYLMPGVAEMHGHYPNPDSREFAEAVM